MNLGAGIFRTQLPKGFSAGGVNCGVRRYRPDLGVIISDVSCTAAAVYTQNTCKAACVTYCQSLLPAENIKAIITNSGQANAATGEQGIIDNQQMAALTAQAIGCNGQQVLTASTGVIGEAMAMDKITAAIPTLVANTSSISEKFATAILTTDLVPKTVSMSVSLSQGEVQITGICKGSGMIHPNMATMLGYLLTDAKLTTVQAQSLVTNASDDSFNMISVDGETSTNDMVFLLANGTSGVELIDDADMEKFQQALNEVSIILAKSIAHDGEGASRLLAVTINGLADKTLARKAARDLTISPLLKTAIYGESPNWGRIIARLGFSQIDAELLDQCQIKIQGITVYKNQQSVSVNQDLTQAMRAETIHIDVKFAAGEQSATAWGCDLTEKYVTINAEYLT